MNHFSTLCFGMYTQYLSPHPDAHSLWSDIRPNAKAILLAHELVEKEGLAGVELAHHCHDSYSCLEVMKVTHILCNYLQLAVLSGVRSNQLNRFVR